MNAFGIIKKVEEKELPTGLWEQLSSGYKPHYTTGNIIPSSTTLHSGSIITGNNSCIGIDTYRPYTYSR